MSHKRNMKPDHNQNTVVTTTPSPQQFREGLTIEHRVAIINKEAKMMMSTGNFEGAIQCCNDAIALNSSPLALVNRAHCFKQLKQWGAAIADYTTALGQEPSHPAAILAQRGICYGKLEQYDEAIDDLNRANQIEPGLSNAFNRGCIFADAGDLESAIMDFNRIICTKENTELKARSIYHRAGAYVKLKRLDDAIDDLRGLLRGDPNSLPPRILLGKALKLAGEYSKAEESLSQALDLDSKQVDIFIERGDVRCRMGSRRKLDDALRDFDRALALLERESDESQQARKHNVMQLAVQNSAARPDPDESSSMSGELSSSQSSVHVRTVRSLATTSRQSSSSSLVVDTGSRPGSRRSKTPFKRQPSERRSKPGSPDHANRRRKIKGQGRYSEQDRAVPDIPHYGNTRIASVLTKRAQARLLVSGSHEEVRSYHEDALVDAEKALRICPGDVNSSLVCVICYVRLFRYQEAGDLLDSLLLSHPRHERVLYHRAFCFRANNNPYKAVECLTKIIAHCKMDLSEEENIDFMTRVYEMRGTLLHEQKAYKIAIDDFGSAISLRPERCRNYYFRGSCHCKLGNFEQALSDFGAAEATGFTNLPFLLMETGAMLRLKGESSSAVEVFARAISLLQNENYQADSKRMLLFCRLTIFKALCLLDLRKYKLAEQTLTQILDHQPGIKSEGSSTSLESTPTRLSVDTSFTPPSLDGDLEWILKYHLAVALHMLKDYYRTQQLLADCVGGLRAFSPDGFALGSAQYFYAVSLYLSCHNTDTKSLNTCVLVLSECIQSPWTENSVHHKLLCYFSRGKSYQRLREYSKSIDDFSSAITILHDNGDLNGEHAAYAYFRRAWSYKALHMYEQAADDFETAKSMRCDDPNFSINYRSITHVEYVELNAEPDVNEPFVPLVPLLVKLQEY